MMFDTGGRSFYSKPKQMLPIEQYDNDYSKMVDGVLSLLYSDEGCWSSEGFETLKLVMSCYQIILANLGDLRKEFEKDYLDSEYASMLDDINRVLAAIEALILNSQKGIICPLIPIILAIIFCHTSFQLKTDFNLVHTPRMEFKTEISSIRLFMICKANRLNQIREETFL